MRLNKSQMLEELNVLTLSFLEKADKWRKLDCSALTEQQKAGGWNALECLEHLNLYGDFYIPTLKTAFKNGKKSSDAFFSSGKLGNYFAELMQPGKKMKKMKTFKDKDPKLLFKPTQLDLSVIDRFIEQQKQMLQLIEDANDLDLRHTKTPITISRWIKLRAGDTLRFVVYHNQRHVLQAEEILRKY